MKFIIRNIIYYFIAIAMLIPICISANAAFQGNEEDETTLKALFIYNFTKHIEWPDNKNASNKFTITIFGHSEITQKLNQLLKTRKVHDKQIEIIETTDKEQLIRSHIVFVPSGKGSKLTELQSIIENKGVLIITEENKMPIKGSCINLSLKNDKMKFEINEAYLKKEGLKVSNQLIELSIASK